MANPAPHNPSLEYRPDIDGLRAVAVLAVVWFHFFPHSFKGGFIGVDIFFVISGYLISTIVFSNLEQGRFSVVDFYNRRIRRIFPSLAAVILACLAFGWFALLADEYAQLGKHVAAGASFLSNIVLYNESGYFDKAAETKPLLHLWSLAIEEQFYIFWPLLLAFVWKRKWSFLRITAVIGVLSFAANLYVMRTSPSAAFYWPVTRFWELMVGGVLAYLTLHRPETLRKRPNLQSATGLLLLALGLALIDKHRAFPGWWALLPTLGTFLLISAGPDAWVNRRFLSLGPLVRIGLISYPLYLWHWVLLVSFRTADFDLTKGSRIALALGAVLLAWATYAWIEKPIRFGRARKASFALLCCMTGIGVAGFYVLKAGGLEGHGYRSVEKSSFVGYFENSLPGWRYFEREGFPDKYNHPCDFYDIVRYRNGQATRVPVASLHESCYARDPAFDKAVFLWGDSHAQQFYYGLREQLPHDWQILQVASSGCPPKLDASPSETDYCEQSNWFALEAVAQAKPEVVLVGQNIQDDADGMRLIAERLRETGVKRVLFTGPTPHWTKDLPKIILRSLWEETPRRTFLGIDDEVLKKDAALKAAFPADGPGRYVSVIDYFCTQDGCSVYLGDDRKTGVTTWDYGHLTPIASNAFARDVLVPLIVGD